MDIPILKYLDILIGLAVVMLLGTTVVAAVTQLLLSSFYFRSRTLRKGLQEFIHQLDPNQIDAKDARLIAENLLRHPALARSSGMVGRILNRFHNRIRRKRKLPPLGAANPTDVIQRSELVLLLMEWAANQGAIANNCRADDGLKELSEKLCRLMVNNGIGDPPGVLQAVRLQAIENERTNPDQPAHVWWNGALMQEAASDLLGKINQGFDNVMARVSQAFRLKANVIACLISFFVAFSIQLDSLALIRRLSVDDKLRDSLVNEAQMLTDRIEKAEKKAKSTEDEEIQKKDKAEAEAEKARRARDEIDDSLAFLRQPRFSIIPETLYWEKLAQGVACPVAQPDSQEAEPDSQEAEPDAQATESDTQGSESGAQGTESYEQEIWNGSLQVGSEVYPLTGTQPLTVESLEQAIVNVRAPVYSYRIGRDEKCLQIVAQSPAIPVASLILSVTVDGDVLALEKIRLGRDREGQRRRRPGVLLSWILLSLGTPFWFDLLKNLLRLRSILAKKDDKERSERENPSKPSGAAATEVQPSSKAKSAKPSDDETGDPDATGAVG